MSLTDEEDKAESPPPPKPSRAKRSYVRRTIDIESGFKIKEKKESIVEEPLARCTYEKTADGVGVVVDFDEHNNSIQADTISRLLKNPVITSIVVKRSLLVPEFYSELANSLRHNTTLKTLEIHSSRWGGVTDDGVTAIAAALTPSSATHNSTLTNLVLWGCSPFRITARGAKTLAAMLEKNNSLKYLFLESNFIHDEGATAIASALKHNGSLQSLQLGFNAISAVGFIAIAEALETNNTLLSLDLNRKVLFSGNVESEFGLSNFNNGDVQACVALVNMLRKNKTLQTLKLDRTGFSKPETEILSEIIKEGCSLHNLNLNYTISDVETLKILYDAVQRSIKVPSIYCGTPITFSSPAQETEFNKRLREFESLIQEKTSQREMRCAFASGLSSPESPIASVLSSSSIFDRKLVKLIFDFSGASSEPLKEHIEPLEKKATSRKPKPT